MEAGRRFLLVPGDTSPGKAIPEREERVPIRLARGRAFGSGLHETTVSCLEALEKLGSLEYKSVLDVGTGTGILSLAALLLGAEKAVAFDIDGDAARSCSRNADLNNVDDRLRVFQGTLEGLNPTIRFDIVLANIHGDIILQENHRLAGHTKEEGWLILSGLDYTDSGAVKSAMKKQGMEEVSVLFLDDYVTQVWRRPPDRDRAEP